jgi:hypothetical protein
MDATVQSVAISVAPRHREPTRIQHAIAAANASSRFVSLRLKDDFAIFSETNQRTSTALRQMNVAATNPTAATQRAAPNVSCSNATIPVHGGNPFAAVGRCVSIGIPTNPAAIAAIALQLVIHRLHHHKRLSRATNASAAPVTTQIHGNTILPTPATTLSLNRNSVSGASAGSSVTAAGA